MTDRKPEVTAEHREAAARVLDPIASNPLADRVALAIAYAEQRGAKRASLDLGRADAWHKNPRYEPKTLQQKLGYFVEEGGEVAERIGCALAAVGKTIRWGLYSTNPELPPEEQETNRDWILRELRHLEAGELTDLLTAVEYLKAALLAEPEEPPAPPRSETK